MSRFGLCSVETIAPDQSLVIQNYDFIPLLMQTAICLQQPFWYVYLMSRKKREFT